MTDTTKMAKNMTEAERQAFLADARRAPQPPPVDTTKMAKDMSPEERDIWLKAYRRRFA